MTNRAKDVQIDAPPKVDAGVQPLSTRPRFTTEGGIPPEVLSAIPARTPTPKPRIVKEIPKSKVVAMGMATAEGMAGDLPLAMDDMIAQQVERMAGIGLTRKDIRDILQLPDRHMAAYESAISAGVAKSNFKVANALFAAASDQTHRKFAQCAIFWAKARMNWRDDASDADAPYEGSLVDDGPSEVEISARFESLMDRYRPAPKPPKDGPA